MAVHIYISLRWKEREREKGRISGDTVAKEIHGCKKRRQPPVTSRLHRAAHAQLTMFREKIYRPNSARQPVKPAARVHRELSIEIRRKGILSMEGKGWDEKVREALSLCIVFQTVSTPSSLFSFFASLPSIRDSPLLQHSISSAAPFCLLRHEEHRTRPAVGV